MEKKNNKSSFRGALLCSGGSAPARRPGFKTQSFIILQKSNSSHLKPNSNTMEIEIAGSVASLMMSFETLNLQNMESGLFDV